MESVNYLQSDGSSGSKLKKMHSSTTKKGDVISWMLCVTAWHHCQAPVLGFWSIEAQSSGEYFVTNFHVCKGCQFQIPEPRGKSDKSEKSDKYGFMIKIEQIRKENM